MKRTSQQSVHFMGASGNGASVRTLGHIGARISPLNVSVFSECGLQPLQDKALAEIGKHPPLNPRSPSTSQPSPDAGSAMALRFGTWKAKRGPSQQIS